MNQYVKHGYLKKDGDKKPYHYSLTKKGKLHAKDPLILKKRREFRYWQDVSRILSNKAEFRRKVAKFIQYQPEIALQELSKSPYFRNGNTFHGYYQNIIYNQGITIHNQQQKIDQLQDYILWMLGY